MHDILLPLVVKLVKFLYYTQSPAPQQKGGHFFKYDSLGFKKCDDVRQSGGNK